MLISRAAKTTQLFILVPQLAVVEGSSRSPACRSSSEEGRCRGAAPPRPGGNPSSLPRHGRRCSAVHRHRRWRDARGHSSSLVGGRSDSSGPDFPVHRCMVPADRRKSHTLWRIATIAPWDNPSRNKQPNRTSGIGPATSPSLARQPTRTPISGHPGSAGRPRPRPASRRRTGAGPRRSTSCQPRFRRS